MKEELVIAKLFFLHVTEYHSFNFFPRQEHFLSSTDSTCDLTCPGKKRLGTKSLELHVCYLTKGYCSHQVETERVQTHFQWSTLQ